MFGQLPVLFMLSHTCTVSFFLLVGEENDNLEECECVKRMETQDIEFLEPQVERPKPLQQTYQKEPSKIPYTTLVMSLQIP